MLRVLSDCLWAGLLQHVWCSSLKLYIQTFQVGVNISCQRILWASDSPEPKGVRGKLQEWAPSLPTSLWVRAEEGLWLKAECVSFLLQMIKTNSNFPWWYRVSLPMQETQVQFLSREDPTRCEELRPCAPSPGPVLYSPGGKAPGPMLQLPAPSSSRVVLCPRRSHRSEKPVSHNSP